MIQVHDKDNTFFSPVIANLPMRPVRGPALTEENITNPLKALLRRLGITHEQAAEKLGVSTATIEKHTSQIPPYLAQRIAIKLAANLPEFTQIFCDIAEGRNPTRVDLRPDDLPHTPEEQRLVRFLLSKLRNPDPNSLIDNRLPELLKRYMALEDIVDDMNSPAA